MDNVTSLLLSLQVGATNRTGTLRADWRTNRFSPNGRAGRTRAFTQIYEGTNQIQRVVIAKCLLG